MEITVVPVPIIGKKKKWGDILGRLKALPEGSALRFPTGGRGISYMAAGLYPLAMRHGLKLSGRTDGDFFVVWVTERRNGNSL